MFVCVRVEKGVAKMMKKDLGVRRLFRHYWDSEYHRNPLFCRNDHHIVMIEYTPYYAENGAKRVKVEVTDFCEDGRWEEADGEDVWVTKWVGEVTRNGDFSRDEANAHWMKHKKVKYVTQKVPKELVEYI